MEKNESIATSPVETPSNQYVINNVQQLFSLNQNLVNFRCNFVVNSLSKEPFFGIVVDQHTLDSGEKIEFKSADQGYLSGEMTQDTNLQTNWYLILKSTKPNRVSIDIQTVPVPPRAAAPPQQPVAAPPQQQLSIQSKPDQADSSSSGGVKNYIKQHKLLVAVVLLAVLGGGYYYYYYKYLPNKKSGSKGSEEKAERAKIASALKPEPSSEHYGSPIKLESPSPSPAKSVQSVKKQTPVVVSNKAASELGDDLLKQIDNLKIPKV